jgi:hypothetical protein
VKNFLLTGRPGSGKSTVIGRTVELLRERGVRVGGVVCPEVREGGGRVGFWIRALGGWGGWGRGGGGLAPGGGGTGWIWRCWTGSEGKG